MLQTDAPPPDVSLLEQEIADRVGGRVAFLGSKRIAEAVFANPLLANVVLLGAAYQLGGLPVSLDDVDRGMKQQGGAAADNREAFDWGRWAVHDRSAVEARLEAADRGADGMAHSIFDPSPVAVANAARLVGGRAVPAELGELLTRRAAQAIDYQDAARAGRYLGLVEKVAARDDAAHDWALTRAVAEAWFKLLTYKDEYEVARLHLAADYDHIAHGLGIEGDYSVTFHLHPPALRRLGLKKKLPMGKPYEIAFHALRRMKRLRGTPLDAFGWDRDRRMERALIGEYERLVEDCAGLRYDTQVAIAESAMAIKGYGPIKEAAVERWRGRVSQLRRESPAAGASTAT
jgi:indolepyruvate ferredoxin oxidoreductase